MASTTRFCVISHEITWLEDVATIVVVTDVACNLVCHYTHKDMRVHNSAMNSRGLNKLADPDYCFTSYNDVSQAEAGDTLCHTFSFGSFGVGEQRWWVFTGSISGTASPSQSAIFTYKYKMTPVWSLGILGDDAVLTGHVLLRGYGHCYLEYDDNLPNSIKFSVR
jgi:hypothetical protein